MSPDGKTEAMQHVDAFVDDANLSVNERGLRRYNATNKKDWDMVLASWETLVTAL